MRVSNRDKLITAYRKQIMQAERQIKELEEGKSIKIQVPFVRQTKVIRQPETPGAKKPAAPVRVLYRKAGDTKPATVVKASVGKGQAGSNSSAAQTYVEADSDVELYSESEVDADSEIEADSDLEADSDIEETYEIVGEDDEGDKMIKLVKAEQPKQ